MASYFKRDITAWIDGTASLTSDEYRVYDTLCNMMYLHEGAIVQNEKGLAGLSNMHVLRFRPTLASLIKLGKIKVTSDGRLINPRVERELAAMPSHPSNRRATHGKPRRNPQATPGQPPGNPRATPDQPPGGLASKPLKTNGAGHTTIHYNTKQNRTETDARAQARESRFSKRASSRGSGDSEPKRVGDIESRDGLVLIREEDLIAWQEQFPHIPNVRNRVTGWLGYCEHEKMTPERTLSSLLLHLTKQDEEAARKDKVAEAEAASKRKPEPAEESVDDFINKSYRPRGLVP